MSSKSDVLRYLQENKGKHISGSDIALKLNISRAGVWKSIKLLEAEGYIINAVTNKGYCLQDDNDIITPQSIAPFLNTNCLGKDIEVFKSVESTNTLAKDMANKSSNHGKVIIANEQTNGKGRLGRTFYSPMDTGIYMSVILQDKLSHLKLEQSLLITSAAAVAVTRAIQQITGLTPSIKWVNDIYINDKKICGILTEASINFEDLKYDYIIVGIGVNISTEDFPQEIKTVADCLSIHCGKKISRSELIACILNNLESIIDDIETKSFIQEYKQKSMIIGKEISIINGKTTTFATAVDIDENCFLICKNNEGETFPLTSGEVSIRLK